VVFGKTVPDISLNAVANLGYAEGRWLAPVYAGDTLQRAIRGDRAQAELQRQDRASSGCARRANQHGEPVLEYCRWVMVRKRDADAPAPDTVIPDLSAVVAPSDLVIPEGLDFTGYDFTLWPASRIGGATTRSARRSTTSTA
jgi:2-methylfumaryl-CoA hydratase